MRRIATGALLAFVIVAVVALADISRDGVILISANTL